MRTGMKRCIGVVVTAVCIFIVIMVNMQEVTFGAAYDCIDTLEVSYEDDCLTWDSTCGPMYSVRLSDGELQSCSSEGAQVLEYTYEGNIVTVTVYSPELPQNVTYILDLSKSAEEQNRVQIIESEPERESEQEPEQDRVITNELGEYKMNFAQNVLEFDTVSGPHYVIDLDTGELHHCSSEGAQVISYERNGYIITLTVYSNELPKNETYTFDFDTGEITGVHRWNANQDKEDKLEYCVLDISQSVLEFDTLYGPYYKLDYETGKIYSCSSEGAQVIDYNKSGNIVTLTVYSDELPVEKTYVFDTTVSVDYNDATAEERAERDFVEYYDVYTNKTIQFDSSEGPYYCINYETKEILGCTSDGAKILKCEQDGDILTLTLYSDELPIEVTYTFDLTRNISEYNENGSGSCVVSDSDQVEYFNILTYENTIEFDSKIGPYYKIDLTTGEILYCTSDDIYPDKDKARIKDYSAYGDNITITVYSAELPRWMTYVFNVSTHNCVCGVKGYDKEASEDEFDSIIAQIIEDEYEGNNVDKETADKIREAYKAGKSIIAKIETSSMLEDRVDDDTMKKVQEKLKEYGLETIQFIEISVAVYADGEYLGKITQLNNSISFTLETTSEVQGKDGCFYVARVHDGEVEVLMTRDKDGNLISFETDRFSTYALIYQDSSSDKVVDIADNNETEENLDVTADEVAESVSENDDSENKEFNPLWIIIPAFAVMCSAIVIVVVIRYKKAQNQKNL